MPVEHYIMSIGAFLLIILGGYWFNRINNGIEEFKAQSLKNKENLARNFDRQTNQEKSIGELSRDIRLMVVGMTEINKNIATQDYRIKSVEEKIKENGAK